MSKQIDELMALADEWADQCGGCDSSHLAENSPYRKALRQALEAALANIEQIERENETNERNLCQLTDELADARRENAELKAKIESMTKVKNFIEWGGL